MEGARWRTTRPRGYGRVGSAMSVIKFPGGGGGGRKPLGPKPIYVFAPTYEQLGDTPRKLCLGYTRDEAINRFYEGGVSPHVDPRVFTLSTAPKWVKFQLVSQLMTLRAMDHPLRSIEEEALGRLGGNPYEYGKGPRLPGRKKRR